MVETIDLADVVRRAVERVTRRAPAVRFVTDARPWLMPGDPQSLERAVTNLLDNAAKWSPAGGTVTTSLADGVLSVGDEGPGIADEDLPHVFDRFYRSAEARTLPGSGLGLAIVRHAVERHGGTVTAARAPEGGTLMVARFPFGCDALAFFAPSWLTLRVLSDRAGSMNSMTETTHTETTQTLPPYPAQPAESHPADSFTAPTDPWLPPTPPPVPDRTTGPERPRRGVAALIAVALAAGLVGGGAGAAVTSALDDKPTTVNSLSQSTGTSADSRRGTHGFRGAGGREGAAQRRVDLGAYGGWRRRGHRRR